MTKGAEVTLLAHSQPGVLRLGVAREALVRIAAPLLPIAVLACWVISIERLSIADIGTYGLLAIVGPWFFAALGLSVVAFVGELARPAPRVWLLAFELATLIIVIDATVPALFHAPEYGWVYKHLGVSESLAKAGHVTISYDIYQQWPAFFSVLAGIIRLSGMNPAAFAAWTPLAVDLAACLLLFAIFQTFTEDVRVAALATLLYELFNCWVGQNYLSPQAFTYLLWLGILLLVLRTLGHVPGPSAGRFGRVRALALRGLPAPPATAISARVVAIGSIIVLYAVTVAAHQLTPVLTIVDVAVLTLLGVVRPRWLVLVLAMIAGGYVASRFGFLSREYPGLFLNADVVKNASGTIPYWGSHAQAFTAEVVRGLGAAMWIGGLAVIVSLRRTLGHVAIPAVLGFSPFILLFLDSYGGEVVYRVFLFSVPWCAFLIATGLFRITRAGLRTAVTMVGATAVLIAGLQGLYGPVSADAFTPKELAASNWVYAHVPKSSAIVLVDQDFPVLQVANYNQFNLQVLPSDPQIGPSWLNLLDTSEVDRYVRSLRAPTAFLVVSRSELNYARYYGYPLHLARFYARLSVLPNWVAIYQNADVTIYRYQRTTAAGRTAESRSQDTQAARLTNVGSPGTR